MHWTEALEIVVERTSHRRYRELCADDHPDHDQWRGLMITQATGQAMPGGEAMPAPDINSGLGWVPPIGPCGGC